MDLPLPNTIHSIVVRCPNWIGDAVMASFFFRNVKTIFPTASVTALAHEPIAELLQGVDGIDEFLVFSRAKNIRNDETKRIVQVLKEKSFDLGILLTRSFSSAWMFWKAGIPWRIGVKAHFRNLLLHVRIEPSDDQHDVLSYQNILSPFGIPLSKPTLNIAVRPEELFSMQERLKKEGIYPTKKIVIINPGAAFGMAKCWPKEHFHTLLENLQRDPTIALIGIGDKNGRETVDSIFNTLPYCHNFAGQTTIRELIALTALSDLVISNDSGPMHIAAALKRPLIALFGSTNPQRTGPWG
jgi:heptosyltransferase-2